MAENSFPVKNVQNIKEKKISSYISKVAFGEEAKTINIGSALEQTVSVVLCLLHFERWKVTIHSRAPATTDGRLACHFRRRGLSSVPRRRDTCSISSSSSRSVYNSRKCLNARDKKRNETKNEVRITSFQSVDVHLCSKQASKQKSKRQ